MNHFLTGKLINPIKKNVSFNTEGTLGTQTIKRGKEYSILSRLQKIAVFRVSRVFTRVPLSPRNMKPNALYALYDSCLP